MGYFISKAFVLIVLLGVIVGLGIVVYQYVLKLDSKKENPEKKQDELLNGSNPEYCTNNKEEDQSDDDWSDF